MNLDLNESGELTGGGSFQHPTMRVERHVEDVCLTEDNAITTQRSVGGIKTEVPLVWCHPDHNQNSAFPHRIVSVKGQNTFL